MDRDPAATTKFYDCPSIIATGLIWESTQVLEWNNPARIAADGSGDGLYGKDCPMCGEGKDEEYTFQEFTSKFGGEPGQGPSFVPRPANVAIFHRGFGCREGGWDVQNFVRDHADQCQPCMTEYMTEGVLARYKAA